MTDILVPLGTIFLTVVAPLWIIFHYRDRNRRNNALSAEESRAFDELTAIARRMETRIISLESVLDAEAPGWRGRVDSKIDQSARNL
jgi:phage shock protein B